MSVITTIRGIARSSLEFVIEVSKSSAPREFAGLLRAEAGVIKDVIFLPGTQSSQVSAVLQLYMLPNLSIAGSVHSHPTSNTRPSRADLALFARIGDYHIIIGAPYTLHSWQCYDASGHVRVLDILDVEFDEDEDIESLL